MAEDGSSNIETPIEGSEIDQVEPANPITRRELFGRAARLGGSVAAAEVGVQLAERTVNRTSYDYNKGETRDETWVSEKIKLGDAEVVVVSIPHHEGEYTGEDIELFESELKGADRVVMEYFPDEFVPVVDRYPSALPGSYGHSWAKLFEDITPIVGEAGKAIDVLDPAFDEKFMLQIRHPAEILTYMIRLGPVYGASELTRRRFGQGLSWGAVIAYLSILRPGAELYRIVFGDGKSSGGESIDGESTELERDIRRVLVAEHLTQLAESCSDRFLLAYPKVHAVQILKYLQDPALRQEKLSSYLPFLERLPSADALLSRRHYEYVDDEWHLTEKTHLGGQSP